MDHLSPRPTRPHGNLHIEVVQNRNRLEQAGLASIRNYPLEFWDRCILFLATSTQPIGSDIGQMVVRMRQNRMNKEQMRVMRLAQGLNKTYQEDTGWALGELCSALKGELKTALFLLLAHFFVLVG